MHLAEATCFQTSPGCVDEQVEHYIAAARATASRIPDAVDSVRKPSHPAVEPPNAARGDFTLAVSG